MRKRYWFLLSTVLIGIVFLLVERYSHQASHTLIADDENEAEFYGEQLVSRQYNPEGRLQHTIVAAHSANYPNRQLTEFTLPVITTADGEGQRWRIRSERGHLNDESQHLHFNDLVELRSLDDDDPLQMTTDFMRYHIEPQHADTDHPVRMQRRDSVTTSVGLHLDIPQQLLQLHSEVTTHHVPVSQP